MASTLRNALVATLVTAGLTIPVLGLQLVREGARTHIETHWNLVLIACAAVFVIQLLRPGGGTVWRQDGYVRRGVSTPVIVPDKRLLFGDRFGNLSLLSMNDGQTLARIEIDDSALATPPLLAGDEAYVQTQEGTIAAIALR